MEISQINETSQEESSLDQFKPQFNKKEFRQNKKCRIRKTEEKSSKLNEDQIMQNDDFDK